MSKRKNEFQIGAFVFAKMKGFPPWPARILGRLKNRKYRVYFFGQFETGSIAASDIVDYEQNKEKLASGKHLKRKPFRLAYEQIQAAIVGNDSTPKEYLNIIGNLKQRTPSESASLAQQKDVTGYIPMLNEELQAEINAINRTEFLQIKQEPMEANLEVAYEIVRENDSSQSVQDLEIIKYNSKSRLKSLPSTLLNNRKTFSRQACTLSDDYDNNGSETEYINILDLGDKLGFLEINSAEAASALQKLNRRKLEVGKRLDLTLSFPIVYSADVCSDPIERIEEDKYFAQRYWDKYVVVQLANVQHGIKLINPPKPKNFLKDRANREAWEEEALKNARDLRDKIELQMININDPSIKDCVVKNPNSREFLDFDYEENCEHLNFIDKLIHHESVLDELCKLIDLNMKYLQKWQNEAKGKPRLSGLQGAVLKAYYSHEYFMCFLRQPRIVWALSDIYQFNINLDHLEDDDEEKIKLYQTYQEIRDKAFVILNRWMSTLDIERFLDKPYIHEQTPCFGFPETLPFIDVFNQMVRHFQVRSKRYSPQQIQSLRLSQFRYLMKDFKYERLV